MDDDRIDRGILFVLEVPAAVVLAYGWATFTDPRAGILTGLICGVWLTLLWQVFRERKQRRQARAGDRV